MNKIDIIGKKFGRLLVIEELEPHLDGGYYKKGRKRRLFKCECECGNIKNIIGESLRYGHTKSCGCLQKEKASITGKKTGPINAPKYAHGWNKGLYGENNPNYKGNTSLGMNIRNSDEYKEWRKKIFERDNYMCFITGEGSNKLVVHHINPMCNIINGLDLCNYRQCNDLWDIDNGITMKKEIHDEFHKIYGRTNVTYDNILEFKSNYVKK